MAMKSYASPSSKRAYEQGLADERAEWEGLGLGKFKVQQAEMERMVKLREADIREVERLNTVIKTMAAKLDAARSDSEINGKTITDLRRELARARMGIFTADASDMAYGNEAAIKRNDDRTDRVVNAIRDLDHNAELSESAIVDAIKVMRVALAAKLDALASRI